MLKKTIFSLLLLFITFFFLSACKKSYEKKEVEIMEKIEGTWKRVNVADISSPILHEWTYTNGAITVCEVNNALLTKDTLYTANYDVSVKFRKKTFTITYCSWSYYQGEWTIHKLEDTYFSFYRQHGGLEYLEFYK